MVKKSFAVNTIPLVCWTILMIVVSSLPGKKLPEVGLFQWDKLAHFTEFFIFTLLLYRYLFFVKGLPHMKIGKLCLFIGLFYAGIDEIHQVFIPNRCCTWQDFVADGFGVGTGVACMTLIFKRKFTK